jgi:hypothetical protein
MQIYAKYLIGGERLTVELFKPNFHLFCTSPVINANHHPSILSGLLLPCDKQAISTCNFQL